ncbi:PQQ-binding-like beta-propeller repeat protein [Gordonia shandongensis]|uniref:PQQ-binding-like beta-propeller repeat protein n=1 Tax=Gordonia shandongensis TaxID=376351 RepID=UPI00041EE630|nr:PQQ-binding-like beta-propeller repeat protein [Gordonia shandongensis]
MSTSSVERPRTTGRKWRIPGGMAAVAAAGAALMVIAAGAILAISPPDRSDAADRGVLRTYASAPTAAWTLDDVDLPGATGNGSVRVAATDGDDWLIEYAVGIKSTFLLVDGRTGHPRWDTPLDAGFGDCAIAEHHRIGCAIRLGIDGPENGFYLIDRDTGEGTKIADESGTASVTGFGDGFVLINQSGYQVSMLTPTGDVRWSRTFADAATARAAGPLLIIETSDGGRFVVDPADGSDQVSCTRCEITEYASGVAVTRTADGREAVEFHPVTGSTVAADPVRTIRRAAVVRGPSTLPVVTAAGPGSVLADNGRYRIIDPADGGTVWQIRDPELSKVHARPCGDVVSLARKDRSRRFFDLREGVGRGSTPPPAFGDPESDIDNAACVGASDSVAVFATPNRLTAYGVDSGDRRWTRPLLGSVHNVDGYLVLSEGSTLTRLRPN